jgi:hypothetical protein
MKFTWAKSDQYLPSTMRLLKVGHQYDAEALGISRATLASWVADGFAVPEAQVEPEPIEEAPIELDGAEAKPKPKRYTRKAIGG